MVRDQKGSYEIEFSNLKSKFIITCRKDVKQIYDYLKKLDEYIEEENKEGIHKIIRDIDAVSHRLAGRAGMFGFNNITKFAIDIESITQNILNIPAISHIEIADDYVPKLFSLTCEVSEIIS